MQLCTHGDNQGYMAIHGRQKYDLICPSYTSVMLWEGVSLGVGSVAVGAGPVVVLVHHPGDEVRGHADHQAIGDDRQHTDGLQNLRPNPWEKMLFS